MMRYLNSTMFAINYNLDGNSGDRVLVSSQPRTRFNEHEMEQCIAYAKAKASQYGYEFQQCYGWPEAFSETSVGIMPRPGSTGTRSVFSRTSSSAYQFFSDVMVEKLSGDALYEGYLGARRRR